MTHNVGAIIGYTALGVAATVGIVYLVKAIKKAHDRKVYYKKANASHNQTRYASNVYGSRQIASGTLGNDVDEMIDSLIANGVLKKRDLEYTSSKIHYKYNKAVKRGVKEMYRRMGQKPRKYATPHFLRSLKTWRIDRHSWEEQIGNTPILINEYHTLKALAAILAEKNYLNSYNVDRVLFEDERKRILKAYHEFQKKNGIPASDKIDLYILSTLYRCSPKHEDEEIY